MMTIREIIKRIFKQNFFNIIQLDIILGKL